MDVMLDKDEPINFFIYFGSHKKVNVLEFTPSGLIRPRGVKERKVCNIKLGKWFRMELVYDVNNSKTYNINVTDLNGKSIGSKTVSTKDGTSAINFIKFSGSNTIKGVCYLDNLKIELDTK